MIFCSSSEVSSSTPVAPQEAAVEQTQPVNNYIQNIKTRRKNSITLPSDVRILVVDDDPLTLRIAQRLLTKVGYDSKPANHIQNF
jgi:PleD family two-component response regulator